MEQLELPFAERFEKALEEGFVEGDFDMSDFDEPLTCGLEDPEYCESCQ